MLYFFLLKIKTWLGSNSVADSICLACSRSHVRSPATNTHTEVGKCVYYMHPLLCILSAHWRVSPFRCPKLIPTAKWKTREKNWSAGTNCPYFQSTNSTLNRQRGYILKYTKDFNPGDLEAEERQAGKSHWKPQGGGKGGHDLFSSKTHNLPRHWRGKILSPQGLEVHPGRWTGPTTEADNNSNPHYTIESMDFGRWVSGFRSQLGCMTGQGLHSLCSNDLIYKMSRYKSHCFFTEANSFSS